MNRGWVNSRIHSNTSSDLWNKRKRIDVLWNTSARMKKQNTSNSLWSRSNRLPLAHLCLHTTLNMCYLIIHIASPKAHKHTRTFTNQTNSNKMFKLFTVNLRWKSFAFHCRCRCRRQWQATTNKQRQWRQPRGRSHARARTHTHPPVFSRWEWSTSLGTSFPFGNFYKRVNVDISTKYINIVSSVARLLRCWLHSHIPAKALS